MVTVAQRVAGKVERVVAGGWVPIVLGGDCTVGRLGNLLSRRRRARQAMDVGSGTIMVALAGRLALER